MMRKTIPFMTMMLVVVFALPAFGQEAAIDYYGYAWETGGFPPSNPGDNLFFTCVADAADPIFAVDFGSEELTFYMSALTSSGEYAEGPNTRIDYTGGTLEIWRDPAQNADWGINPPNPTSPGTFTDGVLYFTGDFTTMSVWIAPDGSGAYEGSLNGVGGTMIDEFCDNCVFTWGGSFISPAQILEGYDLQVDGVFEIDRAVSTEESSWGSVKALFN